MASSETSDKPPADMLTQIHAEKIRMLRAQLPFVLIAGGLVTTGFAAIFWGEVAAWLLLPWVAAQYGLSLLRGWLARRFDRADCDARQMRRWGWLFALMSGLSGLLWGGAALLFMLPGDPFLLAALTIIILAMTAAAVSSLSFYLPAYVLFAVPAITCMVWSLAVIGGKSYILAILTLVFLLANLGFARNVQRSLVLSLQLRFENLALVEQLREQKAIAEQANRAKSRFLAAASHDLRQPLHAIGLFVDALKSVQNDDARGRLLSQVDASLDALGKLFNALLDISRLDAGVVEVRMEHFPLNRVMQKLEGEFRALAEQKGVQFHLRSCSVVVEADPLLLERILRNLISNAIHYTTDGRVVVGCRRRAGWVEVQVYDTGCGVSDADQAHIFDEFHQINNPERDRSKGLGLGLAIVQRLCDLLDYPLQMFSRVDKGSAFCIGVPMGDVDAVEEVQPDMLFSDPQITGQQVLVIDDEADILAGMREILQGWGFAVITAESLQQAEQQLAQQGHGPDVILADLRLRDHQTGIDAIKALQQIYGPQVPGLILTGDTASERLQAASAAGYRMLHKPVKPARLRVALQQLLATVSGG